MDEELLRDKLTKLIEEWPQVKQMATKLADPERGFEAHVMREDKDRAGIKGGLYVLSAVTFLGLSLVVFIWQDRDKRLETMALTIAGQQLALERTLALVERNVKDIHQIEQRVERHTDNASRHTNGGRGAP